MVKANGFNKKKLSLLQKRKIQGTVFIIPAILGLIFVFVPAIWLSLRLAFSDLKLKGLEGYALTFIGFENFHEAFFIDPSFRRILLNTLSVTWVQVAIILIFSLFMATVLNQKFCGRTFARAILFLPVIISLGVVSTVDAMSTSSAIGGSMIQDLDVGTVSAFSSVQLELMLYNIDFLPTGLVDIVVGAVHGLYDVILNSGVQILVFLAGLQSISPSLYEAAKVDGITSWQSFWKITIPMISPLILVNAVYSIIASFTGSKNEIMSYIQGQMSAINKYTFASALSWVYFIVILVSIVVVFLVTRRKIYYAN